MTATRGYGAWAFYETTNLYIYQLSTYLYPALTKFSYRFGDKEKRSSDRAADPRSRAQQANHQNTDNVRDMYTLALEKMSENKVVVIT